MQAILYHHPYLLIGDKIVIVTSSILSRFTVYTPYIERESFHQLESHLRDVCMLVLFRNVTMIYITDSIVHVTCISITIHGE